MENNSKQTYHYLYIPGNRLELVKKAYEKKMGLTPKPMKRLKITGNDASELLDRMFSELE